MFPILFTIINSLKVIFVLFVAKNMDNTSCCGYGENAGCRFLPARHLPARARPSAMLGNRVGLAWQAGRLRLQARRAGILDL
jgi:hypothetical protein